MTAPAPGRPAPHEPSDPVAAIEWPTHQRRRSAIARSGRAALLVVERGHAPPEDLGPLEDWLRAPLDPIELTVRTEELRLRHHLRRRGVHVDDHGRLHHDGRQVTVTAVQQALLAPLLVRIGQPVAREEVQRASARAGGPEHPADLRRALARLRTRLDDVGLGLHLLSGRAVLLDLSVPPDSSHRADQTRNLHETSTHDPDARSTRLI